MSSGNSGLFGGSLWGAGGGGPKTGPPATVNSTLLKAALRKAGVTLAPGRGPSPEQMAEAINEENRMIGALNLNPLNIFTEQRSLYTTIPNQQTNTIGIDPTGTATADFSGQRPWAINQANLLIPSGPTSISDVRRGLKIWNRKQWADKQYQAVYTYPEGLYYDRGYDSQHGFGLIYWFPIPDQAYQMEFYCWQLLQKFASPNDLVLLPDGYEDVIVNNLAVRLDQMPWTVKVPMNPSVVVEAQRSLLMLQAMNVSVPPLVGDAELVAGNGNLSWLTGMSDTN